jgi:hypothetical protein
MRVEGRKRRRGICDCESETGNTGTPSVMVGSIPSPSRVRMASASAGVRRRVETASNHEKEGDRLSLRALKHLESALRRGRPRASVSLALCRQSDGYGFRGNSQILPRPCTSSDPVRLSQLSPRRCAPPRLQGDRLTAPTGRYGRPGLAGLPHPPDRLGHTRILSIVSPHTLQFLAKPPAKPPSPVAAASHVVLSLTLDACLLQSPLTGVLPSPSGYGKLATMVVILANASAGRCSRFAVIPSGNAPLPSGPAALPRLSPLSTPTPSGHRHQPEPRLGGYCHRRGEAARKQPYPEPPFAEQPPDSLIEAIDGHGAESAPRDALGQCLVLRLVQRHEGIRSADPKGRGGTGIAAGGAGAAPAEDRALHAARYGNR